MANELVKYANHFLEAVHRLETTQKKLMIGLSHNAQKSRRNYTSDGDMVFEVSAKSLCEMVGISFDSSTIRESIKKLQERVIQLQEHEEKWTSFQVLGKTDYENGTLKVKLDKDMLPFIVDLNDKWTAYKLLNIKRLRSTYSIRIYELLKSYQDIGQRTFYLDELRAVLDCEDKYSKYGEFKREVILRAQKELEGNCDIKFELIEKKLGHRVDSLTFIIQPNRIFEISDNIEEASQPILPTMEEHVATDKNFERKWLETVAYIKSDLGVTKDVDSIVKEVKKQRLINRIEAREAIIEFVSGPLSDELKKNKMGPPLIVSAIESRAAEWYMSQKVKKQKEKLLQEQQKAIAFADEQKRKHREEEEQKETIRYKKFSNLSQEDQQRIIENAKKAHGEGVDFFPEMITWDNFRTWIPVEVFSEEGEGTDSVVTTSPLMEYDKDPLAFLERHKDNNNPGDEFNYGFLCKMHELGVLRDALLKISERQKLA